MIDRAGLGGQAAVTERLDNFPGFPEGLGGAEFAERLTQQAHKFEVETISAQEVKRIRADGEYRIVETADGMSYAAKAVLIATGSRYKRLGVPGEAELIGSGVHYCATCDGRFYRGEPLVVVGGGNSAVEESLFLARFASHVSLLVRGDRLDASQVATEKLQEQTTVDVLYNTEVVELGGRPRLEWVKVRDKQRGNVYLLDPTPRGLFVFVGLSHNSDFLKGSANLNEHGLVITSSPLETSMPGVFAAGDVRVGSTKQATSAAGEGATAAVEIREYLKKLG